MIETEIVRMVRDYFEGHPLASGTQLEVVEDRIRHEDGWWYVPVRLTDLTRKTYQYYGEMVDIEDELQCREQVDVLLVPAT